MKKLKILSYSLTALFLTSLTSSCGDDPPPTQFTAVSTITAATGSVGEGDNTGPEFNVQLDKANESGSTITVSYDVSGSAISGEDFNALPGSAQIAVGSTQATITVGLINDMDDEEDEDITLTISSSGLPEGVSVGSPNSATVSITDDDEAPPSLPEAYMKFISSIQIELDGDFVVLEAEGIPNHPSPYWETSNSLFEENTDAGFMQNPHMIEVQDWVFRIPVNPLLDNDNQATPGGPIGISINGVPFFNQFAAGNSALDDEALSFDQYNGHPQPQNAYHYHIEPLFLTENEGVDAFLGFLLDGFPVYGPTEDGLAITNEDLDDFHGHSHATEEFPDGIYHYHITEADPYINGDGFYGTAGTVTQ